MHETISLWSCSPPFIFATFQMPDFPATFVNPAISCCLYSVQTIWQGLSQRYVWGPFLLPVVLHKRALLVDNQNKCPKHLSTWTCWFSRLNHVYHKQYVGKRALRVYAPNELVNLWGQSAKLRSTNVKVYLYESFVPAKGTSLYAMLIWEPRVKGQSRWKTVLT
jgi:hypothetical protein